MKRTALKLILTLLCVLLLAGCACEHVWAEADCDTPKTCTECGEIEGAPNGHSWLVATCTAPKTCEVCAATDGEPLAHSWADATCTEPKTCTVCAAVEGEAAGHSWTDATCTAPKTCAVCSLTEGEPAGHDWQDATTEAPKTCAACGATEGERIITDARFTTAEAAPLFGTWVGKYIMGGEELDVPDFTGALELNLIVTLNHDARLEIGYELVNQEQFNEELADYLAQSLYAEFAASGMDEDAANYAMMEAYGWNVRDYARVMVDEMDLDSLYEMLEMEGVYYVDGDRLYTGSDWDDIEGCGYRLEGDTLYIDDLALDESGPMPLKKQ